jgi:predicted ATPase
MRRMELVERGTPLAALERGRVEAAAGNGTVVLLAGEAGVGKTSLIRCFCARHGRDTQMLWGACDALRTPRPLGPLHDIARVAGGDLAARMGGDATRNERFNAFLELLASPVRPVVAVIEDVHWADEATLDLLVFVARRVSDTRAVVVASYRDDELGADHPLRTVLGNLAALDAVRRLRLSPLSAAATAQLAAGHRADPHRLYRITGGNPFFITELLAAMPGAVPETVRDAVLARVARLSPPARAVLQAVAVVPDGAEVALVRALTGIADLGAIDEAEQGAMLEVVGRTVRFRHELVRQAVEQAIPASRALGLHTAVLAHLAGQPGVEPARLAYHADQASDREAVLRHAPAAAARALLNDAGLSGVAVRTVSFTHRSGSGDELWDGLLGGTVRMRALVHAQPGEVQARIRAAFDRLVRPYADSGGLELPVSVKLASGRKPRLPG